MFGYIVVNQQEMKFKEFDEYHRYYCGLCRALKEDQGAKGQLSLSYDMTFLVLLLTGLYEPSEERGTKRCVVHPMTKHEYARNLYSDYAADMNRILTYYKCMDDWTDDKKLFRKLYAELLIPKKELERKTADYMITDKRLILLQIGLQRSASLRKKTVKIWIGYQDILVKCWQRYLP